LKPNLSELLDSEEKVREWQRKINNIELWDMRYLKNIIAEFSQYYYKVRHNETNLGMFNDKLPYPINFIINEKYIAYLERANVIDTLGLRISYLRNGSMINALISKSKRKLRSNSWPLGFALPMGKGTWKAKEKKVLQEKKL